jgi:hypothetical protein
MPLRGRKIVLKGAIKHSRLNFLCQWRNINYRDKHNLKLFLLQTRHAVIVNAYEASFIRSRVLRTQRKLGPGWMSFAITDETDVSWFLEIKCCYIAHMEANLLLLSSHALLHSECLRGACKQMRGGQHDDLKA